MKKVLLVFIGAFILLFNFQSLISAQDLGQGEQGDGKTSVGVDQGGNKGKEPFDDSAVLCKQTGINTAIGCIQVLGSQEEFFGDILKWAIGVGGGIAFLLIVYAGFMVMTSSGNPERLKAGQELLTSALSGLVLLVLSVFILNLIGVKILNIPGFGTQSN